MTWITAPPRYELRPGGYSAAYGRPDIGVRPLPRVIITAARGGGIDYVIQPPPPPPPLPPADWVYGFAGFMPDAINTPGPPAGVSLSNYAGDIIVTTPGTVISRLRISGRVLIRAADVTVRQCEVLGNGAGGVPATAKGGDTALVDCNHSAALRALIEGCYLHQAPATANVCHDGIIGHDFTAQRNRIADVVDYFGVYNSSNPSGATNVLIRGNFGEKLGYWSPDPNHPDNRTHNDGVQIQGGSGTVIFGNHLRGIVSDTVGTQGAGPAADPYLPSITGHVITLTPNVSSITGTSCTENWIVSGRCGIIVVSRAGANPSNAGDFSNNRISESNLSATPIQCDNNMTGTTFVGNVDGNGNPISAAYYAPGVL